MRRIEFLFVGEGPDDEMERAKIVGSDQVIAACDALSKALHDAGMAHERTVRAVVVTPKKSAARKAPHAVASE